MKNRFFYWSFLFSACGLLSIGRIFDERLTFFNLNIVVLISILYFISSIYWILSIKKYVLTKSKLLLHLFYFLIIVVTPILWMFFDKNNFGLLNYINFLFIIVPISIVVSEGFKRKDVLNMFYILISVVTLLALLSSVGLSLSERPDGRLAILGGGPIVFARWMGFGIISLIFLPVNIKNRYKYFLGILFLTMAFSSGSRGPILSLFITALIYLILNFNKVIIKFILFISIVLSFFLFTNISKELSNIGKFDRVFMNVSSKGGSLKSTSARTKFITSSLVMLKKYPLGVGSGNWQPITNKLRPNDLTPDPLLYPHNLFLEVACEYGIQTLVILLLLFIYIYYLSYIRMKEFENNPTSLYTALFYLLIFLTFNSLLSGMLNDSRILFLIMSFILITTPLIGSKHEKI